MKKEDIELEALAGKWTPINDSLPESSVNVLFGDVYTDRFWELVTKKIQNKQNTGNY